MSTVDFVLDYIDVSGVLNTDPALASAAPAALDVSATATVDISASHLNDIFLFKTDSSDIDNVADTDILYAVDKGLWPSATDLAYSAASVHGQTGVILANAEEAKNTIAYDLTRSMAFDMFGVPAAADLFSNETELRTDILAQDAEIRGHIVDILGSSGTVGSPITNDISGNTGNVTRALLEQLVGGSAGSRARLTAGHASSMVEATNKNAQDFFKFRFINGDTLSIRVQYKPNNASPAAVSGLGSIQDRSYAVKLNIQAAA